MDTLEDFTGKVERELDGITPGTLQSDTSYREIEGWSSMYALIIMALCETEYDVTLTGEDLRSCKTMRDLYTIVKSRKN
jgi:acyl carrier protein